MKLESSSIGNLSKKRPLGKTGFEVTEIGFGAWAIGGTRYGSVDEKQAEETLTMYLEAGGNFIDTARMYNASEAIIGKVLKKFHKNDTIFIASKTGMSGSLETIPSIRKELEQSLRLLQRDTIDLYYLHHPPDDIEVMKRVLDEYEQLKHEGKIRAIGASIKGPDVTQHTVDLCRQYIATGSVDAIQVIYSIFRQKVFEVFKEACDHGVGIVARTVLESGFLTGKYTPDTVFRGNDHRTRWGEKRLIKILHEVETLKKEIVTEPHHTLGQIAIRFALVPEEVSTVIVGAKTPDQVQGNMMAEQLPSFEIELVEKLRRKYIDFTAYCNTGK